MNNIEAIYPKWNCECRLC